MKNKTIKSITEDVFMKFLVVLCYVFMATAAISAIVIGITTQELISSCASMVILAMFTLILIFFTIILFAYDIELKRREKEEQ